MPWVFVRGEEAGEIKMRMEGCLTGSYWVRVLVTSGWGRGKGRGVWARTCPWSLDVGSRFYLWLDGGLWWA